MAASVLSVRVDSSIKDSFAELCEELGMTSSVAVNMFMRQMLRERSTRLQEQRFRHTTHSAILEELRRRGIDLYDPVVPGEILDD